VGVFVCGPKKSRPENATEALGQDLAIMGDMSPQYLSLPTVN